MIKNFLTKINVKKNKKIILAVVALAVIILAVNSFSSAPVKNVAKKDMVLTIPAMGGLPALDKAMQSNGALKGKVKELLSYDESYLFTNYAQINNLVTEVMFLWGGLTPKQIEEGNRQDLAEAFIRRVYGLPKDAPIKNNPLLEKYPWASLFQKMKSKILMQGSGHKIYKGIAYYNSVEDKMVVEGELSQGFSQLLSEFIKTQPAKKQKSYINNYLIFIDQTLGLKNLSDEESAFLKEFGLI